VDGSVRTAVAGRVPLPRPPVQPPARRRRAPRAQQPDQQRVHPVAVLVPAAALHPGGTPAEVVERLPGGRPSGQLRSERAGHVLDQPDLQQQLHVRRRQQGGDLRVEVVGDVRVRTGYEATLVAGGVTAGRAEPLAGGQSSQRHAGHPARGATQHRAYVLVGRRDAVHREDLSGLGLGGREVLLADVGHRTLQPVPVPVPVQPRITAGGQHQAERRPGVPGEEVELLRHPGPGEYVGLVEDEHDRLVPAIERGGQPVHQCPVRVGPGSGRRPGQRQPDSVEPRNDIRPEGARITIHRVKADPDRHAGYPSGGQPRPQQRGLAGPSRRRDQGDLSVCGRGQPVDQPRPDQHRPTGLRWLELGQHQLSAPRLALRGARPAVRRVPDHRLPPSGPRRGFPPPGGLCARRMGRFILWPG
jgi:hypothetical protein